MNIFLPIYRLRAIYFNEIKWWDKHDEMRWDKHTKLLSQVSVKNIIPSLIILREVYWRVSGCMTILFWTHFRWWWVTYSLWTDASNRTFNGTSNLLIQQSMSISQELIMFITNWLHFNLVLSVEQQNQWNSTH